MLNIILYWFGDWSPPLLKSDRHKVIQRAPYLKLEFSQSDSRMNSVQHAPRKHGGFRFSRNSEST
jgi:hypothetical protein